MVLLKEKRDDLWLVPLEPSSDPGDQAWEEHSAPQVAGSAIMHGPVYNDPAGFQWSRDDRECQP
jgi:hypothetical protein